MSTICQVAKKKLQKRGQTQLTSPFNALSYHAKNTDTVSYPVDLRSCAHSCKFPKLHKTGRKLSLVFLFLSNDALNDPLKKRSIHRILRNAGL